MDLKSCDFSTERLRIKPWKTELASVRRLNSLAIVVSQMLSVKVTESLPESWQGPYPLDRAKAWISARDEESTVLLVTKRESRQAVGVVILKDVSSADAPENLADIQLGYILAEPFWGQGLATEIILGLIGWAERTGVTSITGGVSVNNRASSHVLEKAGFAELISLGTESERLYKWPSNC